jgi:hypothetical protein
MVDIILKLLQVREQIQVLHWQTRNKGRHNTYDDYFSDLSEHIDEFAEVYQGKYGRIQIPDGTSLGLQDIKELDLNAFLEGIVEMFVVEIPGPL